MKSFLISADLCGTIPWNQVETALRETRKRERKAAIRRAAHTLRALDLIPSDVKDVALGVGLNTSGEKYILALEVGGEDTSVVQP